MWEDVPPPIKLPGSVHSMSAAVPKPRFTWLHLTDLHFGMSLTKAEWPGAEYNVLQDIRNCVPLVGSPIDAIIFSGDLTQKAAADEFQGIALVLKGIREAIAGAGGGVPPFLAIPGNHDVERTAANEGVAEMLRDLERSAGLRERFWQDRNNDYRKSVDAAFARWVAWSSANVDWEKFAAVERDKAEHPGEFALTLDGGSYRIGILGLNTAATQLAAGDYAGKLTMSGLQATSLLGQPHEWSARHDACLLLTHHPPRWLDAPGQDAYRNQVAHPNWFDLHLCGHLHEQERTQVIRGGRGQLRLCVGRSLFGLDEFGEAGSRAKRLFGYSFGQIAFGDTRRIRFWPRADQRKQSGTWVIEADHSEQGLDPDDQGTPVDDLGPSRNESNTSDRRARRGVARPGWVLVDAAFLEDQASAIRPTDLPDYFDGEDPEWPPIASGRIPERVLVREIFERLRSMRSKVASTHLVIGPGGEGKTTVVMQVAAALGREEGWRVLWRRAGGPSQPGRVHWDDLRSQVDDGTALCLVVDDAHEVRGELGGFLRRDRVDAALRGKADASIHLVLCAHTDDWARSRLPGERWNAEEFQIAPLSTLDAVQIIRAYREEGVLGNLDPAETDDALAGLLVAKAHTLDLIGEAALLGALIEVRTGESLDLHVERILSRTVQATVDTSLPVAKCYISTAAANAAGLHRLREDVLRAAVASSEQEVADAIRVAAGELRLEGVGTGRTVRVRHGAIARRAVQIAFAASPTDLFFFDKARVFKSLSRATVTVVPQFWRSPAALPLLNLSVSLRKTDQETAVAIAEGAVDGVPDDIHLRSRLGQTLRELKTADPHAAAATCRDFFVRYPHKLTNRPIRALILEWAVASGECRDIPDHGARSVWLALLSFSDQAGDGTVSTDHVRHLPTVTKGLTLLNEELRSNVAARAAAAILAAGHAVPGTSHLDTAEQLAGEWANTVRASELDSTLRALSQAAWRAIDESFREQAFLPGGGALTFNALKKAVAEASLGSRGGFRRGSRGQDRRR